MYTMWYERVSRWYENGWYEKTLVRKDRLPFKRLEMEGNSSKEYSILAVMSKEEQQALKTCFNELHLRFDVD